MLPRLAGFARAPCPAGRAGDPGLSGTACIRPAEPADVPALAEIRAAERETADYWLARIGGCLAGTSHPREVLPDRTVLVADDAAARAFYARNGAEDLRPSWLVWADITRLAEPSP